LQWFEWLTGRPALAGAEITHEVIASHQIIHFGAKKAIQGLLRPADDRLILITGGVQYRRHANKPVEHLDQRIVAGGYWPDRRFAAAAAVDMVTAGIGARRSGRMGKI
jgi:hypothetical protein